MSSAELRFYFQRRYCVAKKGPGFRCAVWGVQKKNDKIGAVQAKSLADKDEYMGSHWDVVFCWNITNTGDSCNMSHHQHRLLDICLEASLCLN